MPDTLPDSSFVGADLHVHSTHSDGTLAPGEVIRAAVGAGLAAIAITDHDRITAFAVAQPEATRVGIELIPGIELTAELDGSTIHILGYFFNPADPGLLQATRTLRDARSDRFEAIVRLLQQRGLRIDRARIQQLWPRSALGRRHLAEWLVQTGQVPCFRQVFSRYLADHLLPAELPPCSLASETAISLIRGAGGIAALAHPSRTTTDNQLHRLIDVGLAAIEVDWPGQTRSRVRQARQRAQRLGLLTTAGSDFHRPSRNAVRIGSRFTSLAELEALRDLSRHDSTCVAS